MIANSEVIMFTKNTYGCWIKHKKKYLILDKNNLPSCLSESECIQNCSIFFTIIGKLIEGFECALFTFNVQCKNSLIHFAEKCLTASLLLSDILSYILGIYKYRIDNMVFKHNTDFIRDI